MEDFLSKVVPPLLASFGVGITLAYFSRKAKEVADDGQLVYGPEFKALGWFSALFSIVAIIVMFVVDHGGEYAAISGIAALFGLLGIWLLMESYWTKGYFDDQQISMSSFWGQPRVAQWANLKEAAFKKNGQYFELVFSDGTKIGLSKILRGNRAVCEYVESLGVKVKGWTKD